MLKVGEEAKLAALDNGKRENQAEFECDQAMKKCMFKILSQKGRECPNALPHLLVIIAKCKHSIKSVKFILKLKFSGHFCLRRIAFEQSAQSGILCPLV